jgi:hypothetical protein
MLSPTFSKSIAGVSMTKKRAFQVLIAAGALIVGLAGFFTTTEAQTTSLALTGRVTSAAEGAMEGVLVSAQRTGSNIVISVMSNASGIYAFPQDRLQPGRYAVSIRAAGYLLSGHEKSVEVTGRTATELNLQLEEASLLEKALQLTSAEWLYSYPLPEKTKYDRLRDCTRCHSQLKPATSTYDAATAAYVMERMIYSSGSTPASFQLPAGEAANWGRPDGVSGREPSKFQHQQGEAMAAINLSK